MIASIHINQFASTQQPYAAFPPVRLLERECVKPGEFLPSYMWEEGRVRIQYARWGMRPDGVAHQGERYEAPAHNLFQRPAYSASARLRRCLIPIDAFDIEDGILVDADYQTFHHQDKHALCIAGIYAERSGCWGEDATGIAMVTTHSPLNWSKRTDRLPLILSPKRAEAWINPETSLDTIAKLLAPQPILLTTMEEEATLVEHTHEQQAA